ncbi:MAG: DUF4249 domain-containing protein [Bacteroidales bacterium]
MTGILLPLIVFLLQGCREPFDPPVEKYENILVVDGMITDAEGPHEVRLTRSFPFNENYPATETGAVVLVRSDLPETYFFLEEEPGIYRSDSALRGIPGQAYQLFIETSDGEEFESEWVKLKPAPEIDSISHTLTDPADAQDPEAAIGVLISVNTHDPANTTRYYRYEWLETWEILTPISSSLYPGEQRCWRSGLSSQINVATTDHLTSDALIDHPLFVIRTTDNRLAIRYSVLVKQYALDLDTYGYWSDLMEVTQNTGTLFDPIPQRVEGNMNHLPDGAIPVLGLFQACGVSTGRIFIERDELPGGLYIPGGFESCRFYETSSPSEMEYYMDNGFEYVDEYVDGNTLFKIYTESSDCFRCTFSGTNQRPDYWPADQ